MNESGETPSLVTPLPLLARLQRTFILREVLLKGGAEGEIRLNKNPPRLYFHENLFKSVCRNTYKINVHQWCGWGC